MYLYNLTLSKPSAINCAIAGSFSGPKAQEIVVSRGSALDLLRPDDAGRLQTVASAPVFGAVRSLAAFRFPGGATDFVVVGSDSGRLVILRFDEGANTFAKVHQETYGKSGVRRAVPGEYLAVDPKGRAAMVAALEKAKLVYVLNRDAAARPTISSPLEAHKSRHLTFALAALDVGFDNPQFAAVELDYADAEADPSGRAAADAQKQLVIYELDLGLNTVVRKHAEPVDNGAAALVAVPGAADGGPGGVVVLAENFALYRHPEAGAPELRALLPRRAGLPAERGTLAVVAGALRQRGGRFFLFVQSEYGDLYRVSLATDGAGGPATRLTVRYFDTVAPAAALAVLRRGLLFAASEAGDHALYQLTSLGDDDEAAGLDAAECSSADAAQAPDGEEGYAPVLFEPRHPPAHLELLDAPESAAPLLGLVAANLAGEEAPQVYAACGRGARSTLRALRPGAAAAEYAASPLPAPATGVWALRRAPGDAHDGFIVLSFASSTLVLGVGESVEEVRDSGLAADRPTLRAQALADGSLLQVSPGGLRHVRPDRRAAEWRAPARRRVAAAAGNARQVALALDGGELVYFELSEAGMLVEAERRDAGGGGADVTCLDLPPPGEGRARARALAVGGADGAVRLLSLDPGEGLRALATQACGAPPESVLLLDSPGGGQHLHVGLASGVLLRAEVDARTGALTDARLRFLGTRPPRLARAAARGAPALLALSSRAWLGHAAPGGGAWALQPLSCGALDHAAGFASEAVPEGFVGTSGATLRVLGAERLGAAFHAACAPLRYTPRALAAHPDSGLLLLAEADHAAVPLAERRAAERAARAERRAGAAEAMDEDGAAAAAAAAPPPPVGGAGGAGEEGAAPRGPEEGEASAAAEAALGAPRGAPGQWASCVRVVDPRTLRTLCVVELDPGEAALCLAVVRFDARPDEGALLCVGTALGLGFYPRRAAGGRIRVYRVEASGSLAPVHATELEAPPRALAPLRGRLLAGLAGGGARVFDLGKSRLLRKADWRGAPTDVAALAVAGGRAFLGDAHDSVFALKYRPGAAAGAAAHLAPGAAGAAPALYAFADDGVPRAVTALAALDRDTVAGGDRFGSLFVLRLPADASAAVEEDPTAGKYAGAGGAPAPHRLDGAAAFHAGDAVTALQRAALAPGGREALLYGTIAGAIGALSPLPSREDVDFFQHLEMHMRAEAPPLAGRDHLAFRSAYAPVRDVVDGDLCELFAALPPERQRAVAAELDRAPGEVLKKLEDARNRVM